MSHSNHYRPLYDSSGNLYGVLLDAELWNRYRHRIEPLLISCLEEMKPFVKKEEPMQEWEEFKTYWDFKYPFNAEVQCGNCGTRTDDWVNAPDKPFTLKSAQLGGLVVFHCNTCGATVRKKHFKDHVCYEYSASSCK